MNNTLDFLIKRATVREYADKEIDQKLLTDLLKAASHASTTGNMQLYSVVVTRDRLNKEKLAPCHFNQPQITNAPVVLTFCADYNRFSKWCEERKAQPGYNNFHSFLTAMIDTLLFAQNFCVAAEQNGLGICYLGTTTYNAGPITEILNLPRLVVPITTITVGYPKKTPQYSDRLPINSVIHEESYKDYSSEDIDQAYNAKEALEENKHFVEINHKETLAQIFTDIRYTKSDNEAISKHFADVLKKQGFM